MPEKKKFIEIIKENLIIIILGVVITAATGLFSSTAAVARENSHDRAIARLETLIEVMRGE